MGYFLIYLILGIFLCMIGFMVLVLSLRFIPEHKIENSLTGLLFTLCGTGIAWASFLTITGHDTFQIGIPDSCISFLLVFIVFGSFIIRALMDIREGKTTLNSSGTITNLKKFQGIFQVSVGYFILIGFALII